MMLVMQWLALCFATIVHAQSNKIPLYVGSMAPLSGKRSWWGAGITAAMKMAFEYINNRTDILPSYELTLLANDTKGETGLGNKILYDYIRTGKPSLILGPGRSNVAISVADTAKYWKMIQVSASAESGDLSNQDNYPFFFRTISSISASKSTFVSLAKTFHWKRVSILFFSRDMYIKAAFDLKEECERNNITVLSHGSYIGANDAMNQLKHIKHIDARIVFAFLQRTTTVMCLIYKNKLYGQKYGWVVHTPGSQRWWNRAYPHSGCTADQVTEAAQYAISIDYLYLSKANASSISGLTPQQFSKEYKSYVAKINVKTSVYGAFGFDAAWMAAIALNSSTEGKSATRRDLLDIHEGAVAEEIKENLLRTRFVGVTGDVKLESNGDRTGSFEVFQLTGIEFHLVALHDAGQAYNLTYYDQGKFQWRDGKSPSDGVTYRDKLMELSEGHFIVMCVVATFGILLCFGFLHFNIANRNKRCIKMSSPNINSIMIIGCILAYVSVILFSVDGVSLTREICAVRAVALDYGFTIAFGSMFSKTWRVHRITRKLRVKRKAIQDIHLLGMIFMFLFVDTVILIVWYMVDPLRREKKYLYAEDQVDERNGQVTFRPVIYLCTSNKTFTWMLLVFGFKGILLLFGLFLAWETRKVKIATLNDSRYIGMAVYNVCTICAIGVPLALVIYTQHHNLYFYVVAISIVFCTTLTLCMVFVPKIRSLKKSNTDEASERFPTNGIKYEKKLSKDLSESLTNKELRNEIEWLQDQLKQFQIKRQKEGSGRTVSQFVSKPSCYV